MSSLSILKSAKREEKKPYLGFSQLELGNHLVVKFSLAKNSLYKKGSGKPKLVMMVELRNQVLFLPDYYAEKFDCNEEKVSALNEDGIEKYLQFGGSRSDK